MPKIEIELEVTGLDEALEALEIEKESTVFEADLGNDMKFKGTKSDFLTYIEGTKNLFKFTQELQKKSYKF